MLGFRVSGLGAFTGSMLGFRVSGPLMASLEAPFEVRGP